MLDRGATVDRLAKLGSTLALLSTESARDAHGAEDLLDRARYLGEATALQLAARKIIDLAKELSATRA